MFAMASEEVTTPATNKKDASSLARGALSLFSDIFTEAMNFAESPGTKFDRGATERNRLSSLDREASSGDLSFPSSPFDMAGGGGGSGGGGGGVRVGEGGGEASSSSSSPPEEDPESGCDEIPLLQGEIKLMSLKDAFVQLAPNRLLPGILFMTTYRMSFVPSAAHLTTLAATNPSIYSWLNIPLASIDRVEKEKRPKDSKSTGINMVITCKDVRQLRITVQSKTNTGEYEVDKSFAVVSAYAFPNKLSHLFAFYHSLPSEPLNLTLLEAYDAVQEFSRQGILDMSKDGVDSAWRICNANQEFRLCNTYPQILIMPNAMTDEELVTVSNFRSGHRLPTLSWGDKESGATMWRSSQPKAGVSGSCSQDEKFLDILSQSCVWKRDPLGQRKQMAQPTLHVVDCRPRASAMANRAAGAGYESQTSYPNIRLDFYNIANIHAIRDSFKGMTTLMMSASPPSGDINFSRLVEDTQWLTHIRTVLKASVDTATFIRRGMPVLVHCSHGWDRTAQVCSIAQLFLDPFYRTMNGFKILVEKEWCSFGHPFQMRCAHGQDKASREDNQMAPIFLQFLDCVWQIMRQHPHYFEFNARYLLTLADNIYSGRFGTFLFSCDMDRLNYLKANNFRRWVDIWTYLHYNRAALTNPLFLDPRADHTPTTHVLMPQLPQLLRNVTVWTDYFFRWCTCGAPVIVSAPEPFAKLLNDSGLCQPTWAANFGATSSEEDAPLPTKCLDLELPAMVTSDDLWEGLFRKERALREQLEIDANDVSLSPAPTTPQHLPVSTSLPGSRRSSYFGGAGGAGGNAQQRNVEQLDNTIKNLTAALRKAGVSEATIFECYDMTETMERASTSTSLAAERQLNELLEGFVDAELPDTPPLPKSPLPLHSQGAAANGRRESDSALTEEEAAVLARSSFLY